MKKIRKILSVFIAAVLASTSLCVFSFVSSAENYAVSLRNPGFENGSDTEAYDWGFWPGWDTGNYICTDTVHSGSRSVKAVLSEEQNYSLYAGGYRTSDFELGAAMVLKIWVKYENVTGGFYFGLERKNNDTAVANAFSEVYTGSSDGWVQLAYNIPATEETLSEDIIKVEINKGSGTLYIDDVTLAYADIEQPYEDEYIRNSSFEAGGVSDVSDWGLYPEWKSENITDETHTGLRAVKVTLSEEQNYSLSSFACYDEKKAEWVLLKEVHTVYSGEDAARLSEIGSFEIKNEETVKKAKNRVVFPLPFSEMSVKSGKSFPSGEKTAVHYDAADIPRSPREGHTPEFRFEKPEKKITFDMLKADPSLVGAFTAQLSDYELCRLNVCCYRDWRMDGKGEAGFIYSLDNYGMPDFAAADGNNGVNIKKHNIGMPSSTMVSATFNKELAYKVGRVIAEEAVENNIRLLLGPAMNLHRNPLNGRNAEYFSEDPVLAGTMAGWQNKGFQDCGVAGCIKHIAANNCEALRKRSHSIMSERTLREIYLKPFMIAFGIEMPATVMTGYNALNGCFCDEDSELIHGILREEMGFDGFVMSDWNSYDTSDMCAMVNAGVSWLTSGSDSDERVLPLLEGLKAGKISREQLEENIYFLIKTMLKYV